MTKSPKIFNTPYSDNFLSVLRDFILKDDVTHDDLIILPTRRACRKLEIHLFDRMDLSGLIMPNIITFSDLIAKPYLLLPTFPSLHISEQRSATKLDFYIPIWNYLKSPGDKLQHIDDLSDFLNKFYTFSGDVELLNTPPFSQLITKVENSLHTRNLSTSKQIANSLIKVSRTSKQKFYIIPPVEKIPYIDDLIKSLSGSENANIFLQGFDKDTLSKQNLPETDPQLRFHAFLKNFDTTKHDIEELGSANENIVLDINTLECSTKEEEASTTALLIREHLELGYTNIGIFSEDLFFNSLLKEKLAKWHITPNDTNQLSGLDCPSANYLICLANYLCEKTAINLLELLKHPLSKFYNLEWLKIETQLFRVPNAQVSKENFENIEVVNFLSKCDEIPEFKTCFNEKTEGLISIATEFAELDLEFIQSLSGLLDNSIDLQIDKKSFPHILKKFIGSTISSEETMSNDEVTITSFLEARLLNFDMVIIPNMNHPFPNQDNSKKFVDNDLSAKLNFPTDEILEGYFNNDLLAHINKKSYFLRATKVDGKMQTPALFFEQYHTGSFTKKYHDWNIQLNNKIKNSCDRPNPSSSKKPEKLSVSGIETLMENPYGFYAKYILKLKKLEAIAPNLSPREFGIIVHEVIGDMKSTGSSCDDYIENFLAYFNRKSAQYSSTPEVKNYWNLRAKKIAAWIWEYENNIKDELSNEVKEENIQTSINGTEIFARPDRIEFLNNDRIKVIDYKTGRSPTKKEVDDGSHPQLPIEAIILSDSNSADFSLEYHCLSGKKEAATIKVVDSDLNTAKEGLEKLLERYIIGDEPLFAVADDATLKKTRDFIHLARIKEWLD